MTLKKQKEAKKLAKKESRKSMDKLVFVIGLMQRQRDNSVKYGKHRSVKNPRKDRANTLPTDYEEHWRSYLQGEGEGRTSK